jgi:hypothetical protein
MILEPKTSHATTLPKIGTFWAPTATPDGFQGIYSELHDGTHTERPFRDSEREASRPVTCCKRAALARTLLVVDLQMMKSDDGAASRAKMAVWVMPQLRRAEVFLRDFDYFS